MQLSGGTQSAHGWATLIAAAVLAAVPFTAAGCGGETGLPDDGSVADRPIDSILDPPIDAPPIDAPSPIDATVDAAGCGQAVLLQAYYLDWDSTLANPIGLGGARWSVAGDPTRLTEAAPSGAVSFCISATGISHINVSGPAGYIPATVLADPAVFSGATGRPILRGLQTAMATAQYQELQGDSYNSGRAHVMVYNLGTPLPLALSPETNPVQHSFVSGGNFNDITWTEGNTGKLTLFPNRPFGTGTATLTSTNNFLGPTDIPLVNGAFTIVVIR